MCMCVGVWGCMFVCLSMCGPCAWLFTVPHFFGMLIFIWQEVSRNSFLGAGYLDF